MVLPVARQEMFLDFRRDDLPVERALALHARFTKPEARSLVREGRVHVSTSSQRPEEVPAESAALGSTFVSKSSRILIDGYPLDPLGWRPPLYLLLYKPRGVLTSRPPDAARSAYLPKAFADPPARRVSTGIVQNHQERVTSARFISDLVDGLDLPGIEGSQLSKVTPAGRLDLESEGLIVLTSDSSLSTVLTSPSYGKRKTYRVLVKSVHATAGGEAVLSEEHDKTGASRTGAIASHADMLRDSLAGLAERGADGMLADSAVLRDFAFVPADAFLRTGAGVQQRTSSNRKGDPTSCFPTLEQEGPDAAEGDVVGVTPKKQESERAGGTLSVAVIDVCLREGKKHEVRRLMKRVGMQVLILARVELAGLRQRVGVPETVEGCLRKYAQDTSGVRLTRALRFLGIEEPRSDWYACSYDASIAAPADPMRPGQIRQLSEAEVDSIFALAREAPVIAGVAWLNMPGDTRRLAQDGQFSQY